MIRFGKYAIKADPYCYVAGEYKITTDKKTGEEVETVANARYYPSVQAALEGLLQREQRLLVRDTGMTLKEAVEAFEGLQNAFLAHLAVVREDLHG